MSVNENCQQVFGAVKRACDRSGRDPADITIVAVTKYATIETAREAAAAGLAHFGENRAEEGVAKAEALPDTIVWHFIGRLQSKKVKKMLNHFTYIHSLDRLSLAKEIDKRLPEGEKKKCFVQVNVFGEDSKTGTVPEETLPFIRQLADYPAVEVIGLMTMAPLTADEDRLRKGFAALRQLRDQVQDEALMHAPCTELSMGMSNDYELAIEEGATFIRIGSDLVGSENKT
ncbi:YggS family pyridoxal phosphate-dependent enzyme [Salisediminibacterium halotolerans]|uniref:Pyridoxal phosphate homeostasis protein n=1 Tax=Salisediminibacterium halotolerans TaxID=517425 RepID=A0A1H9PVF2_9BACI|nr:YggS family pyridoxal phosphate-dependent enzyme [Salisediminibacterium haloalkalitolerans]SER52256.1 hypothetical protein SAMN05444126_10249 [Salisediminibacterium haloalkalitolerans]